jgi:hypothetical protein
MNAAVTPAFGSEKAERFTDVREFNASGVSWSAVAAGAFVTASFTLIILSLGAGLGLSSLSPWSHAGSAGKAAILWLIFNEIVSSAAGGYLAGRLRTKWASIHNDEVYFRDTAHGLLVWAVAVIVTVSALAAGAASILGDNTSAQVQTPADSNHYFADMLFRSDAGPKGTADGGLRSEAGRIISYSLAQGDINATDKSYLQEMVMTQAGLNPADAEKRVSAVVAEAKLAVERSRQEAAHFLLWMFVALLIGAFSASLAATIGGSQRDHVKAI